MIGPKTSRRQPAWELTLYCLTRSKRLHQESKADSPSLSRVMAAVANQVHSTAQQIGARIGWNPIDAVFLIHGLIITTWASRIPAFQAIYLRTSVLTGPGLAAPGYAVF